MGVKATVDLSSVFAGLENLQQTAYGIARSMCVAGGSLVRDEAKARAPVKEGKLRDAIYLAFRDKESTQTKVVYQVSWSDKKAPHGHLVEFGHMRYNKIINGKAQKSLINGKSRGYGPQDHGGPGALETPKWVPAKPFLRPAIDATLPRLASVMTDRGRERWIELAAGNSRMTDGGEGYE